MVFKEDQSAATWPEQSHICNRNWDTTSMCIGSVPETEQGLDLGRNDHVGTTDWVWLWGFP